jgi:hypothetical protein
VADRIVDIICTVRVPVEDYDLNMADLLNEIESALRSCRVVAYRAPVLRILPQVTDHD